MFEGENVPLIPSPVKEVMPAHSQYPQSIMLPACNIEEQEKWKGNCRLSLYAGPGEILGSYKTGGRHQSLVSDCRWPTQRPASYNFPQRLHESNTVSCNEPPLMPDSIKCLQHASSVHNIHCTTGHTLLGYPTVPENVRYCGDTTQSCQTSDTASRARFNPQDLCRGLRALN